MLLVAVGAFAPMLIWAERRQSAMMQDRVGPERAYIFGPKGKSKLGSLRLWGLVHPLADSLKLATKEDFVPPKSDKLLFSAGPIIALIRSRLAVR